MIKKSIKFTSANEIKEFVNKTMTQRFDIDLIAGRYVADAKSILSVFGLDLDSEVTLGIHATEEEAAAFIEQRDFILGTVGVKVKEIFKIGKTCGNIVKIDYQGIDCLRIHTRDGF